MQGVTFCRKESAARKKLRPVDLVARLSSQVSSPRPRRGAPRIYPRARARFGSNWESRVSLLRLHNLLDVLELPIRGGRTFAVCGGTTRSTSSGRKCFPGKFLREVRERCAGKKYFFRNFQPT